MMTHEQKLDVIQEATKAAPPVAVTAVGTLTGFTLHDWLLVATLVYVIVQIAWLVYKWRRASKKDDWHPH